MTQDRILICNDDGINAEGIHVLEEAALRLSDDVWVVAPALEQSGKGHSFTAKGNLTAVKIDDRHFTVDGTPTDCILFACNVLLKNHKPDFVFSGVNHGSNLGFDVLYSGTTGVAIEGTLQGIKSFAFSLYGAKQGSAYWSMIPEVLPQGLAILCASSKVGKSWMAMQMCVAISQGKQFLDYSTNTAGCLYLALEDGVFRLKDRLNKVLHGGQAPGNFYLSVKAGGLDGGLIKQLNEELDEHPDIKLIIIDTLQKVRGSAKRNELAYATDYRELGGLKEYADQKRICIFLIHHLRKMADENDVFNMISGSNGIMGVCDTIFIIYKKKRQDENAMMFMTGRDIRQKDIVVHFDETEYRWEMVGSAEEEERKRKKREYDNNPIVRTMKELVNKPPFVWRGTATDMMKSVFDVTGETFAGSSATLGKMISEIETQLYYDGIQHTTKRSGANRMHYFTKRQDYRPYRQGYLFDDGDEE